MIDSISDRQAENRTSVIFMVSDRHTEYRTSVDYRCFRHTGTTNHTCGAGQSLFDKGLPCIDLLCLHKGVIPALHAMDSVLGSCAAVSANARLIILPEVGVARCLKLHASVSSFCGRVSAWAFTMHIGAKVADIGRKGRQPCPRGPSHAFRRKDRRVIHELRFFPGAVC